MNIHITSHILFALLSHLRLISSIYLQGAVGTNVTIYTICNLMTGSSGSDLENYAKVNSLILDTYGTKCQEINYDKMIDELKSSSWGSAAGEGGI